MQTADDSDCESTAASETRTAGDVVSEDRVNSPERTKPKKARHELAQSKHASYWSTTPVDHAERRCRMITAVIGRLQLCLGLVGAISISFATCNKGVAIWHGWEQAAQPSPRGSKGRRGKC